MQSISSHGADTIGVRESLRTWHTGTVPQTRIAVTQPRRHPMLTFSRGPCNQQTPVNKEFRFGVGMNRASQGLFAAWTNVHSGQRGAYGVSDRTLRSCFAASRRATGRLDSQDIVLCIFGGRRRYRSAFLGSVNAPQMEIIVLPRVDCN